VAVLYALLAAASFGLSDFMGGLASRTAKAMSVLLVNYPAGAVVILALLPVFPGHITSGTVAWSVVGGVFGTMGVGLLYTALGRAPMNVVSPITAVLSAVVPVVAGVVFGERPHVAAWFGMTLGLVAVVLISRSTDEHGPGRLAASSVLMALGAGAGFGLYFIALARSDPHSGLWPVVIARATSSCVAVTLAWRTGALTRLRGRLLLLAAGSGVLDATANLAFLLASRHGYLSLSSVITALYPAGTVLLATLVLRERTNTVQRIGLGVAVASVALVTL
jgi:drug/metabolite transporter (DMT)-like permease